MNKTETQFFLDGLRTRIQRARLALVWAERAYLLSGSDDDYQSLMDALDEKRNALRAIQTVQQLVAA